MKRIYFLSACCFCFFLFPFALLNGQPFEYTNLPGGGETIQLIDFDNDGDLDFFASGEKTRIYINENGEINDQNRIDIGWFADGSADWGDYDNDGDLDLLICGEGVYSSPVSFIFRNEKSKFIQFDANLEKVEYSSCKWIDYDNDSDLDIIIAGQGQHGIVTKVYRNNNNDIFKEVTVQLPGFYHGSISLGDIDNDGYLDLFLLGTDYFTSPVTGVYHNNRNGDFDNVFPLYHFFRGRSCFGDYNSDGKIDLFLSGINDSQSKIYRNDGNYIFTEIQTNIPELSESILALGDYDEDGDLDFLIAGRNKNLTSETHLYRYDGNDIFNKTDDKFFGTRNGDACFADYDNDGDLDLITSGGSYKNKTEKRRITTDAIINAASQTTDYSVQLTWETSKFSNTPATAQSFNLRIGSEPSGSQIISSGSDTTGKRKVVRLGNVQNNASYIINNLEGGNYFWSVQAVDHSFSGSKFFKEQHFSIKPRPPMPYFPPENSYGHAVDLKLTWIKPRGGDSYQIQVAKDSNFNSVIADQSFIKDSSYSLKNLGFGSKYFWRLKASNEDGVSGWSDTSNFITLLRIPSQLYPNDSSFYFEDPVKLVWAPVSEAASYNLEISDNSSFWNSHKVNLTDTFYFFSINTSNLFFWRVCSVNEYSRSNWSEAGYFIYQGYRDVHTSYANINKLNMAFSDDGRINEMSTIGDLHSIFENMSLLIGLELPIKDYNLDNLPDTVHSVITTYNYRKGQMKEYSPKTGYFRGFHPLPGFRNIRQFEPSINIKPNTWPYKWPDHPEWSTGVWNSFFGKDFLKVPFESYFQIDDLYDDEFNNNFYPVPADTNITGHGIKIAIRYLQFTNPELEKVVYKIYDVINIGEINYSKIFFGTITGFHLGGQAAIPDWSDDKCAYDPSANVIYSWDYDNTGYNRFTPVEWFAEAPVVLPGKNIASFKSFDAVNDDPDMSDDELLWKSFVPGQFANDCSEMKNYDYMYGSNYFSLNSKDTVRIVIALVAASDSTELFRNINSSRKAWENNFGFNDILSIDQSEYLGSKDYVLYQNYPNPFNSMTNISYSLPNNNKVTLKVYDILGNELCTLVNDYLQAGHYKVKYNAESIPSGVYFYKLQAGGFSVTKKLLLLK